MVSKTYNRLTIEDEKKSEYFASMSLSTLQISETDHPSIHPVFIGCSFLLPGSVLGSGDTVGEADIDLAVKLAFQPVCTVFMKSVQIMLVYFVKTAKKTWFHLHMIPSSLIQQLDCNHTV